MKQHRRVTINDIAKHTNLSIATISRVLNNTDYPVSEEKRQQILQAAKELDYIPNGLSKALKTGRSLEIGVLLPSLLNPYYAEVVSGIEKACYEQGYNPVFCSSNNEPRKEREHLDFFIKMRMAGNIVSTIGKDNALVEHALTSGLPLVLFDQPAVHANCDSVTYNFYRAGKMAAEHLLAQGHRDIAFLTLPFDRQSRVDRYEGFLSVLQAAGIDFPPDHLFITQLEDGDHSNVNEFSGGRRLVRQMVESTHVTAIVAINDFIALGAIKELVQSDLRVPEDISVIGFDDIAFAAMTTPSLTTVKQPSFEMGYQATQTLLEKIESGREARSAVVLQPQLIERRSVCSIK